VSTSNIEICFFLIFDMENPRTLYYRELADEDLNRQIGCGEA